MGSQCELLDSWIEGQWTRLNRAIEDGDFATAAKAADALADYLADRVEHYGNPVTAKHPKGWATVDSD